MTEFFKGLRRKIGCVTLVMACGFTGLWVRSFSVFDYIEIPVGKHTSLFMVTYGQCFVLFTEFDPEFDLSSSSTKWLSRSTSQFTPEDFVGMNYDSLQSLIKYRNHPPIVPKGPNQPIRVPKLSLGHWLIGLPLTYLLAIPLTLLSAFLLLTKPRQSNLKKIAEPTANEGA